MFKFIERIINIFLCYYYECEYVLSGEEFNRRKLFLCTRICENSLIDENTYFVEPKNIDFIFKNEFLSLILTVGDSDKILFLKVGNNDRVYFYKNKIKDKAFRKDKRFINRQKIKVSKIREHKIIEGKDFCLEDYYSYKQLKNIYKNDPKGLTLKYVKNKTKNLYKVASDAYLSNVSRIPIKYKNLIFYNKKYGKDYCLNVTYPRRNEYKLKKTYSYYTF
jgi:hypothetical protein